MFFFLQNQNVENLKSEQNFQNTNIKSNVVHARARRRLWALPIISVKRHPWAPMKVGHPLGEILATPLAAPDQRPMIRCKRMHRESRPWDFFSRALPFRRKPRRRRVADAGRLELQHFRTTVPHRRRRFLRRNRQYLYRMM